MNLIIKNLTYSYESSEEIIKDFSVETYNGCNVLLIGDNGTGKSTFGKLVCGLIPNYTGSIKINEKEIIKMKPKERVHNSYYVSQINQLQFIKNSLIEEIQFTEQIATKKHLLSVYKEFYLPEDFEFNPFDLSVNEAWRFSLFLSTIVDPIVLFIDELPSSVNKNNLSSLNFLLNERKAKNKITFLCYQRNINFSFDRTFIIENGSINEC